MQGRTNNLIKTSPQLMLRCSSHKHLPAPLTRTLLGRRTYLTTSSWWSSGYPRIPLALVLEFYSHRGEILSIFAKCKKEDQLLRLLSSVGKHNSTRVDEERKS